MRENRLSGSEGGATLIPSSLPLSIIRSLRDEARHNRQIPIRKRVDIRNSMPFPDFLISKQSAPFNQLGKERFFDPGDDA